MKRLLTIFISILLLMPLIGDFSVLKIKAEDYYPMNCDQYEVDYINDDGSFGYIGSYSSLAEAKSVMKSSGNDYVVRHDSSPSPTKIVAMNSGVVYSYPGRSGTNTLNIYQNSSTRNIYYKQTYITNHYEMRYIDTERFLPNLNGGIVEVEINGFHGYADIEFTDLVPSKYLDRGIGLYLGGNNNYNGEQAFYVIPVRNYYEVVNNGSYVDLAFHFSRAYPEYENLPSTYTIYIGKAPSFMNAGTKYYSSDGVNFYSDYNHNTFVGTYYNYYQFLPLRSKTNISADTIESFLRGINPNSSLVGHCGDFITEQNTYGVNGLLLFAMACQESAYGTSGYATQRNNLFGWNAYDSSPGSASYFSSLSACINEQAGINLRGYIDITDGRFFSSSLGNKGSGINVKYASDPYWGMKIASLAYKIDKYSKGNDGTYTDLNNYSLAKINKFDAEIKSSASDSANTLYTTQYGPYYQQDFIVIVLENGSSYTKIQSTNAIDSSGNIKTHRTPITTGDLNPISTYDFGTSVAYIKSSYLDVLNYETTKQADVPDAKLTMMSSLDSVSFVNNNINLSGCAFIKGISHNDASLISHKILIKNITDNSVYKTYTATTKSYPGIKFNDSHVYDLVGYDISIPLSELAVGNYYFVIQVVNGTNTFQTNLLNFNESSNSIATNLNNYSYHLSSNTVYGNRLELDVESIPSVVKYENIVKPSTRNSLFSFDNFSLDSSGRLLIEGQAMIYYCNYDNQSSIQYTLYIIDSANNYKEIALTTVKSPVDFKKMLKSSFNMDYICYKCDTNISDLIKGNYKLVLKIVNGSNVDYFELRNPAKATLPTTTVNSNQFRFYTSTIRDRIMLEVK